MVPLKQRDFRFIIIYNVKRDLTPGGPILENLLKNGVCEKMSISTKN